MINASMPFIRHQKLLPDFKRSCLSSQIVEKYSNIKFNGISPSGFWVVANRKQI